MNQQKSTCDMVIIDGELSSARQLTPIPSAANVVYEVIRLVSGVPLFIEAHLERMNRSLHLAGFSRILNRHGVKESVHALAEACSVSNQNIRINVWQEKDEIRWTGYFVESHYPEPSVYRQGISTGLLFMERINPNAKVWQKGLKEEVTRQCEIRNLFEMILVDSNGFISEGSRSNLFFTQGGTLFTAPDQNVLEGITRQKLLELVAVNRIPLVKREIAVEELESFDGAFITGTSIHLLPVARIDAWERRSSEQPLIRLLMAQFEEAAREYENIYTYE